VRRRPLPCFLAALALVAASAPPGRAGEAEAPRSLDELPSTARDSVTALLAKSRREYGEDAVVMQAQLLLNTLRHGSQLAAGVRIAGVEEFRGTPYLRFVLETGLVFDDRTRDRNARVHMLWAAIMEPTLASVETLEISAEGVAVDMQSHHRPYETNRALRATIDDPGTVEHVTFYVRAADVNAVRAAAGATRELFGRALVVVDDAPLAPAPLPSDPPTFPGPDASPRP
jgi:hypothetical protein